MEQHKNKQRSGRDYPEDCPVEHRSSEYDCPIEQRGFPPWDESVSDQERRDYGRRLSDKEFEALARRAAEYAVHYQQEKIERLVSGGRKLVNALLWIGWAIGAALALWHHQTISMTLFGM